MGLGRIRATGRVVCCNKFYYHLSDTIPRSKVSYIPAGTYSIRSLSQYSGTIYIYKKNSTTFDDYYSIRYGETLGKVTLEDGWKVEVMGTLVFALPEAPAFH